ncbi:MAG: Stp1/IreP family PP2C-type Ser/Thr phosphatase [Roseburia sp.]|nr:Stp1/IreP family PP2C-type Ser/Thr phosphatase [Roseburia sp.]
MKTFSMTDAGRRRDMNQDYMFASETAVGKLPNLFIVADGMGGHKAGEFASKTAVETIVEYIRDNDSGQVVASLKKAIGEANRRVLKEAIIDIEKEGMGTTIVVATIKDDKVIVANVGDSRLYIVNESSITQITVDHSFVEEMIRSGRIARTEARNHPDKNKITRAVGVFPKVDVDFFEVKVVPGDMILMCTDGLTNMVDDEEIKRIVLGQRDIVEKTATLIETANKNGGTDNITALLIEPFV